jgi:hypothetical protein
MSIGQTIMRIFNSKCCSAGMMAMISVGLTALPVVAQRPTPLDPAEPLQGLPQPKDLER